ncbi:MAG: S-adenosyl-l-methionine hydroxide adenosyltransferase family protein [Thermodesulfovibrionales bacterium]
MPRPIITLTTDYGYRGPLTGIMKGIILGINPDARIVDITHEIERYNIREAALTIAMSYNDFPSRTIHVVVVDPGVGGSRRPILVATDDHYFIGPDNGVFSMIYNDVERFQVIHLSAEHYFLPERSMTFHGRDIFAPVAAWLSKGTSITNLGEPVSDYVQIHIPKPSMPTKNAIEGEIIYIDHFGNAISNIRYSDLAPLIEGNDKKALKIVMKGKQIEIKDYYAQAEDRGLYAILNSMNYLELFVYRGDASKEHNIKVGDGIGVIVTPIRN